MCGARVFPETAHMLRDFEVNLEAPAAQPRWSRDGTQLFYIAPDKKLMAVHFNAETGRTGAPRTLFQTRIIAASLSGFQYDVAPDGRFLINSLPSGSPPLTMLTGWTALLNR